jgi:hypothetical protein
VVASKLPAPRENIGFKRSGVDRYCNMQHGGEGMPEEGGGSPQSQVHPLAADEQPIDDAATAYEEANQLLELKARYFSGENRIRCHECEQSVNLDTEECFHCGADNAEHLARIREQLRRLDEIAAELYARHEENLERHRQEVAGQPLWQRIKGAMGDRQLWMDLEVVVPSFLVFFTFVITLRLMGHGALFWAVSVMGGLVAYFLLSKSRIRRDVTLDVYRMCLVVGVVMVVSSAVYRPMEMWPRVSSARVEVTRPIANIREAPTTESTINLEAQEGEKLIVLDRDGAWYQVKTEGGELGWVHSSLVSDAE